MIYNWQRTTLEEREAGQSGGEAMRELSLFTGAGGGLLGTKLLGWEHIGYVEINDYCQRIIAQRIKDGIIDEAPIFGDIRAFIDQGYADSYKGLVDVVTGGFPCQDISAAGKGKGIKGEKSSMWFYMADIIRKIRPSYVLVENSPMLCSRGLGSILGDLAAAGYNAKWGVFSACAEGLPHTRERLFIMANAIGRGHKKGLPIRKEEGSTTYGNRNQNKAGNNGQQPMVKPCLARGDNGLANWVHRIRAIGNGQVPAVVRSAWKLLSDESA